MTKLLLVGATVLTLAACTAPESAERTLRQQGYTDIRTGGYSAFGCSEKDTFATKFSARSPSGHQVNGVVCKGLFKGSTIRLFD